MVDRHIVWRRVADGPVKLKKIKNDPSCTLHAKPLFIIKRCGQKVIINHMLWLNDILKCKETSTNIFQTWLAKQLKIIILKLDFEKHSQLLFSWKCYRCGRDCFTWVLLQIASPCLRCRSGLLEWRISLRGCAARCQRSPRPSCSAKTRRWGMSATMTSRRSNKVVLISI